MIAIKDESMPQNCLWCPVRLECKVYMTWRNTKERTPPTPEHPECRLVDMSRLEDDLR